MKTLSLVLGLAITASLSACGGTSSSNPPSVSPPLVPTNTIRVPADQPTIQSGIDNASDGFTVLVSDGVYTGAGNTTINFRGKRITLTSVSGAASTVIDCENTFQGMIFENRESGLSIVSGFTIRRCMGPSGAAIQLGFSTSPTIISNIFEDNNQDAGGFGAAIGGNGASPRIEKNTFRRNTCDGQSLSGVVSFINDSSPIIVNNILADNPCRAINFTIPFDSSPRVINNTIVNNATGVYVDARVNTSSQVYRNNILVGNAKGLEVVFGSIGNNPTWENNLLFNNAVNYDGISDQTGSNGNLLVDPMFMSGSFRLFVRSPAIDAGSPVLAPVDDFDGIARPRGNGFDIGAFESL